MGYFPARMILIVLVVPFGISGCESLYRASETMNACDASMGGTRQSCEQLNRRRQNEAETARRKYNEQVTRKINRDSRVQWNVEVKAAMAQNHAAIAARYPKWGWLSGVWCHTDKSGNLTGFRFEILDKRRVRHVTFKNYARSMTGSGSGGASYESEIRHLRSKGGLIEAWGGRYAVNLQKLRKGPGGKLLKVGSIHYVSKTTDREVPFSGTKKKEFNYKVEYRRCNGW